MIYEDEAPSDLLFSISDLKTMDERKLANYVGFVNIEHLPQLLYIDFFNMNLISHIVNNNDIKDTLKESNFRELMRAIKNKRIDNYSYSENELNY